MSALRSVGDRVMSGTRPAEYRATTHPSDRRVFPPPGTASPGTTSTETAPFPAVPPATTYGGMASPFPAVPAERTSPFPASAVTGRTVPAERASSVRPTPSGEPVPGQDPKAPEQSPSGPYRGRRRLGEGADLYQVGALADALEATWKSTRSDDVDDMDKIHDSDYSDYSDEFAPNAAPRGRRHRPDDSSARQPAQPPTGVRGRHRKN